MARPRREWATSPRCYRVRVGWHVAHVSDNVVDLLALIDGSRTIGELAAALAERQQRPVHPAEIVYLLQRRLMPARMVSVQRGAVRAAVADVAAPAVVGGAMVLAAAAVAAGATSASPGVPLRAMAASPHPATPDQAPQLVGSDWATWDAAATVSANFPAAMAPPGLPSAEGPATVVATMAGESPLPAEAGPGWPAILPHAQAPEAQGGIEDRPVRERAQRAIVPAAAAWPPIWQPVWRPAAPIAPVGNRPRTWFSAVGTLLAAAFGVMCLLIGLAAGLRLNVQLPGAAQARHSANQPAQVVATPGPPRETILPGETAYTVRPGDTLAHIASTYRVSAGALLIVNADILPTEAALVPGMRLAVPAVYRQGVSPTAQPRPLYYVIRPGDTLYGVAQKFGTTLDAIASYNHLVDPGVLTVGIGIVIPPAGA